MSNQTAANSKILQKVKKLFNSKIYKHARQVLNSEGEAAMFAYLQTFFRPEFDVQQSINNA